MSEIGSYHPFCLLLILIIKCFIKSTIFCRSQNEITRAFLCVKIGGELLSQTISSHREKNDMMLRTIEVFIVALAVYEQLMKRKRKDDSKTNENDNVHLLVLDERKKLIDDWLSKFIFYPSVEKDLKVNNQNYICQNNLCGEEL